MPATLTALATRVAGRPLLLTPRAAHELAQRVGSIDPQSVVKPGRFSALIRKLSGTPARPMAMEDDEDYTPVPMETRLAYAPLYAGEPDDYGFCWTLKDGVALMQIDKPLLDRGEFFCGEVYHGYDTILQGLREAMADDRVRAVFIRSATPGGMVAGGLPALAEFMRANGARAGGKPIWVYADMACSAGYWIASAADRIVAPRVGLIGSIGAVIVHENYAGALKEAGVVITPIQFGEAKTDGAWWAELSDRARGDLQAEIDQCGRDFVADVVAGRPQLTPEAVLATQAAVFMGHHDDAARSALALNLVDALSSEEEAFAALRDQVGGQPTPGQSPSANPAATSPRAVSSNQEHKMTIKPKAGAKPAANTALSRAFAAQKAANAAVARLRAEAAPDDAAETEGEEEAAPTTTTDEEEMSAEGQEDEDGTAGEDDETAPEAERISASAEAAANPAMALAAIRTGQSFAQFKANVRAATGSGKGQLAATLSGSPRLGADAAPQKSAGAVSASSTWQKNRAAGLKR